MNDNLLKKVIMNKSSLVPYIFTEKQFNILVKNSLNKSLTNSERKAFYTSIKKKMESLRAIYGQKEFFISGSEKMIPERFEDAKKMIEDYKYPQMFVSGSFLFAKQFNDIDIFIITGKGYTEKWEDNRHLIFLTEKRLEKPVFQSAAKISVSTFPIKRILRKETLKLNELLSSYHEATIEILDRQDREMTRFVIFNYHLHVNGDVLDGKELKEKVSAATQETLDNMIKAILRKLFSSSYLYVALHEYIKTLDNAIEKEKNNEHLKRYKSVYEDVIHESRRSKAEAA